MKTTMELPDELLIAAKKRAAELRRPLRALIERGLRRELDADASRRPSVPHRKLRWVTVDGGLPPGLDMGDRGNMHAWLARERNRGDR